MTDNELESEVKKLMETEKHISMSLVQRRFAVGYITARRVYEQLVSDGYIDADGNVQTD